MEITSAVVFALIVAEAAAAGYDLRELRCGICKAILDEMKQIIRDVPPGITANVGSHRLDEMGNLQSKVIPLVQSESFLTDAMEKACKNMENYARGYDKKTGNIRVVKLFNGVDKMNPEMEEIEPISDSDLNQSLFLHCDDIIDTYEDEFVRVFQSQDDDLSDVCITSWDLCSVSHAHDLHDL